MKFLLISWAIFYCSLSSAQNLGVGTASPAERLDINGNIKVEGTILKSGGNPFDFLRKNTAGGKVAFRKGHGAIGMRYIICVDGCSFPSSSGSSEGPFLSEIKLFAGDFAPPGWMFCEGQSLLITAYDPLFNAIGTIYGGNGTTEFKLPDLRGAVPIGVGTGAAITWTLSQKTN